jgi:hypothetical protein
MRRFAIAVILALSLMGASAISSPTGLQNQNSNKSSNKNSGKSSNKNSTRSRGNRNTGTTTTTGTGNPNAKVWVNTQSGVYHCAGTRWYGKTKSGEYMTQKEALEKNYHADHGKACQ